MLFLKNEDLSLFESEKEMLEDEFNKSIFYLPGKIITENSDGKIAFYPSEDISQFEYGQGIESEFLKPSYLLSPEDKEIIRQLKMFNAFFENSGFAAVRLTTEENTEYITITNENTGRYFKFKADNYTSVNLEEISSGGSEDLEKAVLIN
ncbi:MAG: hypothetical protein ACTTIO_05085 [Candidatus Fimenecus sp.]